MKKNYKLLSSVGLAAAILVAMPTSKSEAAASTNVSSNKAENTIEKISGVVTVNADRLNLRSGPSLNSKVVRVLKKGERYKAYGKANGMYQLGGDVWVSAQYASFEPYTNQSTTQDYKKLSGVVTVKADRLNLRSGPSLNSKVVRVLKKGERYKAYGQANGMYELGGGVWVSADSNYSSYEPYSTTSSTGGTPQSTNQDYKKLSGVVTVKADRLNLRSGPTPYSKVVRVLKKGDRYKAYGQANGMYELGGDLWVSADPNYSSYEPYGAQNTLPTTSNQSSNAEKFNGYVVVKADRLNLRSGPSLNSKVVRVLEKGEIYKAYGESNGMYELGGDLWVSASPELSEFSTSLSSLQVYSASVTKTNTAASSSTNKADEIINYAKKFMGLKYVWGSASPSYGGFDCSGFIYYVFKNNGYNISRTTVEGYWNMVQRVSTPQVGDLVFYQNTYRVGPSHMGIYLGNNKFLNAGSSHGVAISDMNNSYWKSRLLGYGRFK
ncbi:SH3 domain-containing protein [Priestia filamentosa]|uniref:C40 family peptidase n=1 Tax=Priestia filamentosa TaxID=1402861 RepID=UPI003977EA70